ncbi:hypothetical protein A2U01_0095948, partial [Trifolium medium]|nr:hypothetical protein [Trifolium medium]
RAAIPASSEVRFTAATAVRCGGGWFLAGFNSDGNDNFTLSSSGSSSSFSLFCFCPICPVLLFFDVL